MSKVFHSTDSSASRYYNPEKLYHYPLYLISMATGLTCPINLKTFQAYNSRWHKLYSCSLLVAIVGAAMYSAYGRYTVVFRHLLQTVRIVDIIQQVLLLTSNVYAIANAMATRCVHLNKYFDSLKTVDKQLCTVMVCRSKKCLYYSHIATFHVIMTALCICDYLTWNYAMGLQVWKQYAFRLFSIYLNIVIGLQLIGIALALHERFLILNDRLLDIFKENFEAEILRLRTKNATVCNGRLNLSNIINIHDTLCDVIDAVNVMYGLDVVLLVLNIIVNCVMALNITLLFGTGIQVTSKQDSIGGIVALNVAWAFLFIMLGVTVSWSCVSASNEGTRTATLAFKLLNLLPVCSASLPERQMREQLLHLAHQVEHRRPQFSAGGFFSVDQSMLFAIMGAISSYIVIIIQFNNSPIPVYTNSTLVL